MKQITLNVKSSFGGEKYYRPSALLICFLFLSSASLAIAETLSIALGGVRMDFVWVPIEGSGGFKQVELGDFGGGRVKEQKRSESIYAPFERDNRRGYYLGKTEVSQEQWAAVMGEGVRTKLPATGKTSSEVQLFLERINRLVRESGEVPRTPDGAQGVVKLPTEAEWEYAARGGEGPHYAEQDPYGGDLERYEVLASPSSDGKAKQVGSRPPNRLGLHDMLGNVRELMEDNYSVGGVTGGGLLLKGGSYLSEKGEIRSSSRTEQQRLGKDGHPSRRPDAGLRLCLSAEIFTALGSKAPELDLISAAQTTPSNDQTAMQGTPSQEIQSARGSLKFFLTASERDLAVSKAFYSTLISALNCIVEDSPYRKRGIPFVAQRDNAIKLLERAASHGIDEGASAQIVDADAILRRARKERMAQAADLIRKRAVLEREIKRLEWNHKMMFSVSPLSGKRSGTSREIQETEEKIGSLRSELMRLENPEPEARESYTSDQVKFAEKLRDISFALASEGYYLQSLVASGLCRLESPEVFNAELQWGLGGEPQLSVGEFQNTAFKARERGDSNMQQTARNQTGALSDPKLVSEAPNLVSRSLAEHHLKTINRVWSIKKTRSRFDHFLGAAEFADAMDSLEKLEFAAVNMPEFQIIPLADRKKLIPLRKVHKE